jgi:hypothetical protein
MPVLQRRQDYEDSPRSAGAVAAGSAGWAYVAVCNGCRPQRSITHERLGPAGGMEWVWSFWLPGAEISPVRVRLIRPACCASLSARMSPKSGQRSTVDVDWIAAHLGAPGVRLVEIDVSRAAYDEGHIAGAVLWNAYTDLRDPSYKPVGFAELERLLSRSGITPEPCVVTYGYSARLGFWLLRAHGHEDVRMLMARAISGRRWDMSGARTRQPWRRAPTHRCSRTTI